MEAILGFNWFGLMKVYPGMTIVVSLPVERVIVPTFEVEGYPTGFV